MIKNKFVRTAMATLLVAAAGSAGAAVITLGFEGIENGQAVGDFYNGGGGYNYGISFTGNTVALVDCDHLGITSGCGNFANEPSPNTVMYWLAGGPPILTLAAGFEGGFSFWYSSLETATVSVYASLDGTGDALGSIDITGGGTSQCVGDPNGAFCNWTAAGVSFVGVARSIAFGGAVDVTAFDNITFGSATPPSGIPTDPTDPPPPNGVPEPTSLALAGAALLGLVAARRRRAR